MRSGLSGLHRTAKPLACLPFTPALNAMNDIGLTIDPELLAHMKGAAELSHGDFELAITKGAIDGGAGETWTITLVPTDMAQAMLEDDEARYVHIQNERVLVYPYRMAVELSGKHLSWAGSTPGFVNRA